MFKINKNRLRDWDTRSTFRDVYTPQQIASAVGSKSVKIGLYSCGVGRNEDQLVGALAYSLEPDFSLDFIAVAPTYRRQDIATYMVLAMLVHMQSIQPDGSCIANIPCGANLDKPWLSNWLESLDFDRPDEYLPTAEGVRMHKKNLSNEVLEKYIPSVTAPELIE